MNPLPLKYPEAADRVAPSPGRKGNRKLYVVTCISNPVMYRTRYDLYRKFAQYIEDSGATLYTCEMAFGDRPHEITESDYHRHVQVRSSSELWHKENMLNLAIQQLPDDWEYVAWIDADVKFADDDWVNKTIEQLQHYQVVQMFSHAQDLGPRNEPMATHTGFVHDYYHGKSKFNPGGGYAEGHPGYAWAATRKALDAVGGLLDWPLLGSGDRHMACALIGKADASLYKGVHPNYGKLLGQWEKRAERSIKRNIGYLPGLLTHYYHGSKANRHYTSRWRILVDNQFDPLTDLYKDTQGLWRLDEDRIKLRDDVRKYFRSRHEDDISEGNGKLLA